MLADLLTGDTPVVECRCDQYGGDSASCEGADVVDAPHAATRNKLHLGQCLGDLLTNFARGNAAAHPHGGKVNHNHLTYPKMMYIAGDLQHSGASPQGATGYRLTRLQVETEDNPSRRDDLEHPLDIAGVLKRLQREDNSMQRLSIEFGAGQSRRPFHIRDARIHP